MRWSHIGHIYIRLISQHFKAVVEYQLNFVIMLLAGVFTHVPGLIFLWLIYASRYPVTQRPWYNAPTRDRTAVRRP